MSTGSTSFSEGMTLDNLGAAYAWSVDLVERVAAEQGWTESALKSGLSYVDQALDQAWASVSSGTGPIGGLVVSLIYEELFGLEIGADFFAYLVAVWPVRSGFPDSWNKLEEVWINGQETAEAEQAFDDRYFEAAEWFIEETVEDVKQATKVATIGTGTILAIAGLVYVATR